MASGLSCDAEAQAFAVTAFGRTVSLHDVGLPLFTITMGLLDGLNPCSMWVLILMISLLAPLHDRRRMLAIAGTFVLVEGVASFAFMAAWLNLFGTIILGVLVQLVELLCTSGFPALFTRILTLRKLEGPAYYGYLFLYDAAYMLDDVIVLAIGVVTLSNRRLQEKRAACSS